MKNNRSGRILIIDMLKAFAIILVVLGHCIQFGSGIEYLNSEQFFDNVLFKIIYTFHMPLFMLISGFLFAYSYKGEWVRCVQKRIQTLVVPMAIWAILIILKKLIADFDFSICLLRDFLRISLLKFWFIWAVFWCSCVVIIVNNFFKNNIVVYAFLFVISFVIPDAANMALYKYMYPYFIIGFIFQKHCLGYFEDFVNKRHLIVLLLFSLVLIYVGLLSGFNYDTYIYTSGHCIIGKDILSQLKIDIYRYTIGFVGSIIVIILFIQLCRLITNIPTFLLLIGKETMGIYIISTFINSNLLMPLTYHSPGINYLMLVIETLSVLILSLIIIQIINKSSILKRLLLGKLT